MFVCLFVRLPLLSPARPPARPPQEDTFRAELCDKRQTATLNIVDIGGSEDFARAMLERWIPAVHGFIFVFSVTSRSSVEYLRKLRDSILLARGTDKATPIVLVGTKNDSARRKISMAEAQALADEWGVRYVDTSASTGSNATHCFQLITSHCCKIANAAAAAEKLRLKKAKPGLWSKFTGLFSKSAAKSIEAK